MIKKLALIGILFVSLGTYAQSYVQRIEDIEQQQSQDDRHVVIYVHTDWCNYCKMMEKSTFQDEEVQKLLATKVYFTQLDAATKNDIVFADHTFKFKPTGYKTGVHELAEALANIDGRISYPTITILNPKNEIIFQYAGYLKPEEMRAILQEL